MNIDEQVKNKVIAIISALVPHAKIYLFGSRSRGTHGHHSDIDIALDTGSKMPVVVVDEINSMLAASSIFHKIEVLDIYSVSESMRDAIEKEKIIWKS